MRKSSLIMLIVLVCSGFTAFVVLLPPTTTYEVKSDIGDFIAVGPLKYERGDSVWITMNGKIEIAESNRIVVVNDCITTGSQAYARSTKDPKFSSLAYRAVITKKHIAKLGTR